MLSKSGQKWSDAYRRSRDHVRTVICCAGKFVGAKKPDDVAGAGVKAIDKSESVKFAFTAADVYFSVHDER